MDYVLDLVSSAHYAHVCHWQASELLTCLTGREISFSTNKFVGWGRVFISELSADLLERIERGFNAMVFRSMYIPPRTNRCVFELGCSLKFPP
jgi:hypothetical protein